MKKLPVTRENVMAAIMGIFGPLGPKGVQLEQALDNIDWQAPRRFVDKINELRLEIQRLENEREQMESVAEFMELHEKDERLRQQLIEYRARQSQDR